jgi:hypothetical protein
MSDEYFKVSLQDGPDGKPQKLVTYEPPGRLPHYLAVDARVKHSEAIRLMRLHVARLERVAS